MSTNERYWTAIFKVNRAFLDNNPYRLETPYGTPVATSIGDLTVEGQIMSDALDKIKGLRCACCSPIAKKAIDEVNEYVGEQMELKARAKK
jgi:hypothetical protein